MPLAQPLLDALLQLDAAPRRAVDVDQLDPDVAGALVEAGLARRNPTGDRIFLTVAGLQELSRHDGRMRLAVDTPPASLKRTMTRRGKRDA